MTTNPASDWAQDPNHVGPSEEAGTHMVDYVYFDAATGRIAWTGLCSPLQAALKTDIDGYTYQAGIQADRLTDMIVPFQDGWSRSARTAMYYEVSKTTIEADGEDAAEFTGLPTPCTLVIDPDTVDEQVIELSEPDLSFTVGVPGTYTLVFRQWPFFDTRSVIIAL